MSTVLVTGGAGYIGSHACKALAMAGHVPITLDTLERGHRWAVKWGPLEVGDIGDAATLDRVFAVYRPDCVLHFAAYAYVGESVTAPALYYRNNVLGTLSLLEAMRRSGCARIVFSSSCAVYGIPTRLPISEDAALEPINAYGSTKLAAERLLVDFEAAYGLRSVRLRYFNAAGADPDGDIGEDHSPETHIIPLALQTAAGLLPHMTVFGNDYGTPDGTCIRDFIHVGDLAEAHVLALEWLLSGNPSRCFNLGTGQGHSVETVIAATEAVSGRSVARVVHPRRPGDPAVLIADPTRANVELGWHARSTLQDQVRNAWAWHQRCRLPEATETDAVAPLEAKLSV
ncbi:UDP-glucose 4-epimerase GalE [Azospirillum argentinense]